LAVPVVVPLPEEVTVNDTPDLMGHVWIEGKCKRCEMHIREVPIDVRCHARDWLEVGKTVTPASREVP
jgi:hypothetical protein